PEAKWDVIFEPGYTTKFNEVGIAATGIGLSHVRDIVQSLAGQIKVESAPPRARGTTFRIAIPKINLIKGVDVDDTFYHDRG
ncbi:ATP-binding protein, partial [Clostridioides difficile]